MSEEEIRNAILTLDVFIDCNKEDGTYYNAKKEWEALDVFKKLQQENKHLKDLQKNMDQQYEKLESNWNTLKEILDNTLYKLNGILDRDLLEEQMLLDYSYIRNKIQELEGKNE